MFSNVRNTNTQNYRLTKGNAKTHLFCHLDRILQRLHDGVIPVNGDAAQVEYGRGREVDIR